MIDPNQKTDMEIVLWLGNHIENPCGPRLRENYIRTAKRLIPSFTNPYAKEFLEGIINKYDTPT